MDNATKNRFAAPTDQTDLLYGESACVETPPDFFAKLNEGFNFDLDLCANEQNHLLPRYFGPGSPIANGFDALTAKWYHHDTRLAGADPTNLSLMPSTSGFANPPYGSMIPRILKKAIEESKLGFTSAFLLPMRAGNWYTHIVLEHADYVWHLEPRLTFWWQGKPKPTAKRKATKKDRLAWEACRGTLATNPPEYYVTDDGYVANYRTGEMKLEPANALFDSIVVVFKPWTLGIPKAPYTVQPRPWAWKTQSVKELMR